MRGLRTIPVHARHVRRHGGALPRRLVPQLHEPDGDQLPRREPGHAASAPSACATACRAPRSSSRSTSASRTATSTTSRPASTTWRSTSGSNATARTCTRGCRRCAESGAVPDDNRVRYEMLRHFGYFVTESSEHFAEYVPWFVKRDRPDLIDRFNVPLDEYPRRCEEQIAGWEAERARLERRRRVRSAAELRVRRDDHPQHRDRQAARDLRQRRQRRPHRRPPGRVHGRGAVPRRRQRRAADARSARFRRSSPR